MNIRVLGCYGSEMHSHKTTCFQLSQRLVLDAGAIVSGMSIEEMMEIDDIVISHSHLDHIKDLAMLADIMAGKRRRPIRVHGTAATLRALKRHFFNQIIWPDFTVIPSTSRPVIELVRIKPMKVMDFGQITLLPVPVNHSVDTMGFIIREKGGGALAVSSDTGTTDRIWEEMNNTPELKAAFVELSFPEEMVKIARLSGHLTPRRFMKEISKIADETLPIYAYHFKPGFLPALHKQIPKLERTNLFMLDSGDVLKV